MNFWTECSSFILLCFCASSLILIRSFIIHFLCLKRDVCVSVCIRTWVQVPVKASRGHQIFWRWSYRWWWATWRHCWASNSGSLQEQCLLSLAEPLHLPRPHLLWLSMLRVQFCGWTQGLVTNSLPPFCCLFHVVPPLALLCTWCPWSRGDSKFLSVCLRTVGSASLAKSLCPWTLWFW